MTEKEKMIAGELYLASDPQLLKERQEAQLLFQKFNSLSELDKDERHKLINNLIGKLGEGSIIEPLFFCDYGYNIIIGKNCYINYGCCILDDTLVSIGDNCMFGPNVQIYTATHPLEYKARNSGKEFSKPISIGNNVWVGGNATLCPGVSLGNNVVVEAGMPEMEAIQSATITNAMLLKMEDKIGQIKPDFIADIIAVNDDPTASISTMENVTFVMKDGVIYKK